MFEDVMHHLRKLVILFISLLPFACPLEKIRVVKDQAFDSWILLPELDEVLEIFAV